MNVPEKLTVGILFGGQSAEHEISILSARNVLAALERERFEALLFGIDPAGRWLTQDAQHLLDTAIRAWYELSAARRPACLASSRPARRTPRGRCPT